jgi:glycine betaine/choline ABC-type transport system substrate-binding protein
MMPLRLAALCFFALGLVSCGGRHGSVTIGSNDFAEQILLAEIMAETLEESGIRVERKLPSGTNRANLLALQSGQIDLYPEYDGTLAALVSRPVGEREGGDLSVADLAANIGLELLEPFGFRSDFAVAVRRDFAIRYAIETISDLEKVGRPLRFATDEGHAARAVDGISALARHYGLVIDEVVTLPVRDRSAAYAALLRRDADAAIVFTADAQAGSFGMRILEDDRDFFPDYRALPVMRREFLESRPEIREALQELSGKLSDDAVRDLVYRVELGGEDYREVARSFLGTIGILDDVPPPDKSRTTVRLAVEPLAQFDVLAVRAFRAIREVMPARRLDVVSAIAPLQAVRAGDARYGLVGADAFFTLDADGRIGRVEGVEVVGVVGSRLAHLITLESAPDLATFETIRVGVAAEGSASYNVATLLAAGRGAEFVTLVPIAEPEEYAQRLVDGDIDVLFFIGSTGHAGLMALLSEQPALTLRPVDDLVKPETLARFPFLRVARIPAGTYPGQAEAVDSFSMQAVLAATIPTGNEAGGDVGPVAVPGLGVDDRQRVQPRTAAALNAALGVGEEVDPILPTSPGLLPAVDLEKERIQFQPAYALFNVFAIFFLAWVIGIYFKPLPETPELPPKDDTNT